MDDPIKVIWKLKNRNKNTHYHLYIFVGNIKPKSVTSILDKIKNLNLLNTLLALSDKEYKLMEMEYNDRWYENFFVSHHINYTKNLLRENKIKMKEIIDKMGQAWYDIHVKDWKIKSKTIYNYAAVIKEEQERKNIKKINKQEVIEQEIDFRTGATQQTSTTDNSKEDDIKEETSLQRNNFIEFIDEEIPDQDVEPNNISSVEQDDPIIPSSDDVTEYDAEQDKELSQTKKLIADIIASSETEKKDKIDFTSVPFNSSKDENMYDDLLKDIYIKEYIFSTYIFKDDTIKTIKNKICLGIQQDPYIDKDGFIIPSRQYLWAEYFFNNAIEKIMIGQKWIQRSDLLKIDIEPKSNIKIYEKLRDKLKLLKDSIRRLYGDKIKRDDDDFNILLDYDDYITNNELFLLDIYHEFGKDYTINNEDLKNLYDVYIRIYFPKIKIDDITSIIEYLGGKVKTEQNKILQIHDIISNDLFVETEVMKFVENVKRTESKKYNGLFTETFVTQSVIHVNLRDKNTGLPLTKKLDLRKIYDNFIVSSEYPFLQYQTIESPPQYKYHTPTIMNSHKEGLEVVYKWFENEPFGISFKFKNMEHESNKYMPITLNENGRIEYKTQWKESDKATIENIKKSYVYVRKLLKKINSENKDSDIVLYIPSDTDFKYAFINTIQRFDLPKGFVINHNDLSEFARYFFPYIALVIDPRKRQSKVKKFDMISKYGTYLRYKRISKYENAARIEHRILYFMRNYEYTDATLASEISRQFNFTEKRAAEELEKIKLKYPALKKSRIVPKKLSDIPKYKPPGIGIDIQGKMEDKYKMKIVGARSKYQLDKILELMRILVYLYIDTYLYKKPERQMLKEKLKKLVNIAKRRHKVDDITLFDKETRNIKKMAQADQQRIGFSPEKGQNPWSKQCQNSGTDQRRQPELVQDEDTLQAKGYSFNSKSGFYERTVSAKQEGKKVNVTLRAVKLPDLDSKGLPTGKHIYYISGPENNGEHMFVGFLMKSTNPYGHCMPCSFKKDHFLATNKKKRDFYLRCIGEAKDSKVLESDADKLYILQDTNKMNEGRLGALPKYLDVFLNVMLNKEKKIKNHYLSSTSTGYFFKYGISQDNTSFLNTISIIFNMPVTKIKKNMITLLTEDKNNLIFTSLNNGDIKTQFETKEQYIKFIKENDNLEFEELGDILSIPGVLNSKGVNIIIFQKIIQIIRKNLEKELIKEDYITVCQNTENCNELKNPDKINIILIKDNKAYYPVVIVNKKNITDQITHINQFKYNPNEADNIIVHISQYYNINCCNENINVILGSKSATAKKTYELLMKSEKKEYYPKYQIIDVRNKCKYLITQKGYIIPTRSSGSIYNLQIAKDYDKWILPYNDTFLYLMNIEDITGLPLKPIGIYYDNVIKDKSSFNATAIMTASNDSVPVKPEKISKSELNKKGLLYENKPIDEIIDKELELGPSNFIVDSRITNVMLYTFDTENYEIFRLELSEYLSENKDVHKDLTDIINDTVLSKTERKVKIRMLLYKISNSELYSLYSKIIKEPSEDTDKYPKINEDTDIDKNKYPKFNEDTDKYPKINEDTDSDEDDYARYQKGGSHFVITRANPIPTEKIVDYKINNSRSKCGLNQNESDCSNSLHCSWKNNKCQYTIQKETLIRYINKISIELLENSYKAWEILKLDSTYFVSNVVNLNIFKERPDQTIVKSSNVNIKKHLSELFGKDAIPQIGKRRVFAKNDEDLKLKNMSNPLRDMGNMYVQNIIPNNDTFFRAFANAMFWNMYAHYDISTRNLGYYNTYQTELSSYYKSLIVWWLLNKKNKSYVNEKIIPLINPDGRLKHSNNQILQDYVIKMVNSVNTNSTYEIELLILSKNIKHPIYVYNDMLKPILLFIDGEKKDIETVKDKDNVVNLKFTYLLDNVVPSDIEVIYFK